MNAMGTMERRQREKENLRRAILDAARELFVTQGFDNVSMRKIADKIEYSPTTIYLHFKDKDEIFIALSEEGFNLLSDRLEPFHIKIANPIERLRQGAHAYFSFAQEHPHYYRIMFEMKNQSLSGGNMEALKQSLHFQAGYRTFSFIMRCVHEGIAQGLIPHGDLSENNILILSHVVWASIHGVASLVLAERTVKLPCDLPQEATQVMLTETVENTLRGLTNR